MIDFRENEHIIFEIRKHWFIIATELTIITLLAFLPLIIPSILEALDLTITFGETQSFWSIFIFLYSFWVLILWIMGFVFWTNYYLDVWIVTNEKILDVEQIGLFSREVSMLHLERIQDVTVEVKGFVATLMKFGDLHVQTAGQQREFIIHNIPQPDKVAKKINNILMKHKDNTVHELIETLN
jgi:uncharacterized membrane protein YdbT with pleckstrin-like domain